MFISRLITLLALLVTFLVTTTVYCEELQSKAGASTFTMIAPSSLPYETLYYRSGAEYLPIELRKDRRSEPYSISSAEFVELYTDHSDPEVLYRLIGKGTLANKSKEILFFLVHVGSNGSGRLPVLMLGLDDSKSAFPDSSFRFINFINAPLVVEFDHKQFRMKPGQQKISKLDLPAGGDFTPFTVKNIEGEKLAGTRLFSHAQGREMVLIFPPKEGKRRLNIQYYSD